MSLNPRIKRILLPPATVVPKNASPIAQLDALYQPAEVTSSSTNNSNHNSTNASNSPIPSPRLITQHPVLPWIAYILEDRLIIVQHTVTKEILYHTHWHDVAATVYGETELKKLPAAAKSLGRIRSLQFYDCSTIYWSGLHTITTDPPFPVYPSLAVQTDRRVMVLNLRRGAVHISSTVAVQCSQQMQQQRSYYRPVTAHVCEKTVSSVPSSTVLPLTDRWLLVGCTDGSMKCFDWTAATTVKKIKGLGKGDCVVQLLAANPYARSTPPQRKRILTVTKRGSVFLIELELQKDTLEIQPPMARFTVPSTDGAWENTSSLEQTTFSYDAHSDTFQWYHTAEKQEPILYIWDLKTINTENSKSGMAKPEPSLVIHYPAVSSAVGQSPGLPGLGSLLPHDNTPEPAQHKPTLSSTRTDTAILAGLVHPAFTNTDTLVSVSLTANGDFCIHGVSKSSSTTTATPVVMVTLGDLIMEALGDETDTVPPSAELQVFGMTQQPLGAQCQVVISTNWGVVVVELGIATNPVGGAHRTMTGTRHWHLGAGLGSLGKAVVGIEGSGSFVYGSIDVTRSTAPGLLPVKNPIALYTSPVSQHMPQEFTKRPFRMGAQFLTSPTGAYVAVFWPAEFRYEILHTATALQSVGNNAASNHTTSNPVVASGTGISDICWVTDFDIFCVLHAPGLQEIAARQVPKQLEESPGHFILSPLGVVTKTAIAVPLSATKLATTAAVTTTTVAVNTTMTAANMTANVTTKAVRATTKGVTQMGAKALGIFGKKKKADDSIMTADNDEEENTTTISHTLTAADLDALTTPTNAGISNAYKQKEQQRYVEFRQLEAIDSSRTAEGGIPVATCASLGKLTLRGGSRVLPAAIYGGPVLCVATKTEEGLDGQAHFYTPKSAPTDIMRAADFSTAGPALPFPETVVWDDDGRLCAIVIENRVAVYLSNPPEFVLLGTVHIGSPSAPRASIVHVKFVHGALFCCTWNSVHCVFLGDLTGGICHMDSYLLACTEVAMIPETPIEETVSPFAPIAQPLPLVQPCVLGYQGGSLIVSSLCGVHAVSLNCPLIRIGIFLSAGHIEKATKWFDAVPEPYHGELATFLERRGHPELILLLPGLSLETLLDVTMRFGYVDRLEDIVETYGIHGLHEIDMGQGVVRTVFGPEPDSAPSVVVSVGAYLLAHGRVELARRMAAECLRSKDGKKDAFMLATLLMPVDQEDSTRLVQRAVTSEEPNEDWLIGNYVRNHLLNKRT